jgi:hypothetical protein
MRPPGIYHVGRQGSRVVMAPRRGKEAAMSSWANVLPRRAEALGAWGSTKSMKARETLIRLKKFQVEERRRTVAQIESMISGFEPRKNSPGRVSEWHNARPQGARPRSELGP